MRDNKKYNLFNFIDSKIHNEKTELNTKKPINKIESLKMDMSYSDVVDLSNTGVQYLMIPYQVSWLITSPTYTKLKNFLFYSMISNLIAYEKDNIEKFFNLQTRKESIDFKEIYNQLKENYNASSIELRNKFLRFDITIGVFI